MAENGLLNGDGKGFAGLDSLVSNVDEGLKAAERTNRQHDDYQTRPERESRDRQAASESTDASQPGESDALPPVEKGGGSGKIWLAVAGILILVIWVTGQDGGSVRDSTHSVPSTNNPETTPTSVSQTSTRSDPVVRSVQQELREMGYQSGPIDGLFGSRTEQAIQKYQFEYGHAVTGAANYELVKQIQTSKRAIRLAAQNADSFADRFVAQVWLSDMSRRLAAQVDGPDERLKLLTAVHSEATRVDLPPELILAVIDVESGFDRSAVSVEGARGLMQVMPYWLQEIGRPNDNLMDTRTNLRYGCTILRYYIDQENGDLRRALGRYDDGLGSGEYPNAVIDRLRTKWFKA